MAEAGSIGQSRTAAFDICQRFIRSESSVTSVLLWPIDWQEA